MRPLPPLNAVRAFEAAARRGSFTAAAAELGVSHAAISRHVRGLEARLGVPLLLREGRGLAPTEAGRAFAAVVADAFDRLSQGMVVIAAEAGRGRLRLSVEPAFAGRWLVPRLGAFRKLHPGIDIELDPTLRLADFRADQTDLAIRYGRGGWPGLAVEKLMQVMDYPVCAPAVAAGLATPADLRGQTLLHDESAQTWSLWLAAAGITGIDASRGPRFLDVALALDAAMAGEGVAMGDDVLCARDIAAGRLVRLFDVSVPRSWYWLAMPEDRRLSPAAGAFRAWLLGELPPVEEEG
ncbi:transcriptional regulator GcvA [Inquilinus sp. NPDC058860]|uniref:transcriptional regulator GcvA n=1 Tax=Inquilinus sp. NPDC058860 TaxID=3346652 RepID=UPI0036BDD985